MKIIITLINLGFGSALLLNTIIVIPQIIKVLKTKSAGNLSFLTFFGFCILQAIMILHGYFHHDPELAVGMLLSFITMGTLVILMAIFKYRSFYKKLSY